MLMKVYLDKYADQNTQLNHVELVAGYAFIDDEYPINRRLSASERMTGIK